MKQALLWRVALMTVLMTPLMSACAASVAPPRLITATGSGQAAGQSDVAIVTFGYWTKDEDPNKALVDSKSKLAEATVQLAALGIDQKDIQLLGASVNSEAVIGPDGYPTERLLYAVNQTVNVSLHDSGNLGAVLNMVRQVAGAPYIYGLTVTFDLSESRRAELLADAQAKALEDAKTNAQRLAQAMGVTLGSPAAAKMTSQQVTPALAQVTVEVSYDIK